MPWDAVETTCGNPLHVRPCARSPDTVKPPGELGTGRETPHPSIQPTSMTCSAESSQGRRGLTLFASHRAELVAVQVQLGPGQLKTGRSQLTLVSGPLKIIWPQLPR